MFMSYYPYLYIVWSNIFREKKFFTFHVAKNNNKPTDVSKLLIYERKQIYSIHNYNIT